MLDPAVPPRLPFPTTSTSLTASHQQLSTALFYLCHRFNAELCDVLYKSRTIYLEIPTFELDAGVMRKLLHTKAIEETASSFEYAGDEG